MLLPAVLSVVGYLAGSMMFAAWLVQLHGRNISEAGDGNPGAVNAFRAAGPLTGIVVLLLDFLKGALPVAAAYWLAGVRGWWLVPVIVAPVLGHIFPAFRRFRGGKGIAVTFGVWAGLTLWEVPCMLGAALLLGRSVLRWRDAFSVLLGMNVLVVFTGMRYRSLPLTAAALACGLLVLWRHRRELARR